MLFAGPVCICVGTEEPVTVDLTILHLPLPTVGEGPLFGFYEIASEVGDGGDVLI